MRSVKWVAVAVLAVALAAPDAWAAPRGGTAARTRTPHRAGATIDNSGRMDVNNLDMVVTNHGSIAYDLITGNSGLIYPKGGTRTAVFAAGLWVGAKVAGETRLAIGEYSQEFTPGPMADSTFQPDVPAYRNYRIERGGVGYADYLANAVPQGAPVDNIGNPLLFGDATIWSVFNDADPGTHTNDAGSTTPLGLEVQQTVFAFNRAGALGNIIFVKWKFINKGGNQLDSAYVSVWSDPDLGGFTDDLVGCDTTLSLGYCYNATNADGQYGSRPPAVGYDFFQGPRVWNGASYDTLGMTSFNKYINGTDPAAPEETYNYMRGLNANGSPIHVNGDTLQPITTFQVSGDPVTNTGWLDSNPNDRRLFLSAGPFSMAPGDTQEVVTAIIIGQGSDRLTSVSDMKAKDAVAQLVFDLGFDICAPPPSPTVYAQPLDRGVRLAWGSEPVGYSCVNAALGQDFRFEGIRIWQMASNDATAQPTVIATYDEVNGVGNLFSDEFSAGSGTFERTLKVAGTESGLSFQLDITRDAIVGGNLVNNRDYYYAVTAYAYDLNNAFPYIVGGSAAGTVTEILESARNVIVVAPRSSSAVFGVTASTTGSGPLNTTGTVEVSQFVQNDITANDYRVSFDDLERWSLTNLTTSTVLFPEAYSDTIVNGVYDVGEPFTDSNGNNRYDGIQTNVSGDFNNPVVEGVMVRVTAPRQVSTFGEATSDTTQTDMTTGQLDGTASWHFLSTPLDVYTFHSTTNHDFEIRILPDTTEFAWAYGSGEVSFVNTYKVPYEIWDLGFNSLTNTLDDVKLSVMIRDRDLSGSTTWDDAIYIRDIPYASVDWDTTAGAPNPVTKSVDYVADGSDQLWGRWRPRNDAYPSGVEWPAPTTIRIISERFTSADEYQFTTVKVGSAPGTVVGRDVKKILAVPNPYYATSKYELTQFDRTLKFTNIPAAQKVTIRIFNLGGDLIRTIRREATTADEQAVATINWDLNTDRNLPVASGVYIYRVDVDGVGTKTDRLAVFVEQERLDNF